MVTFRSFLRRLTHVPTALLASLVVLVGAAATTSLAELIAGQRSVDATRSTVLRVATGTAGVLLVGLVVLAGYDVRRRRRAALDGPAAAGVDPSLLAEFESAARAAVAAQLPLSCVIVEVDRYADFIATQGPAAAEVLVDVIEDIVRQAVRASDTAVRAGATRFVIALPDTTADAAMRLAERIRESIVRALLAEGVTVSGGVAGLPAHAADGADLIAAAEAALADARRRGRNQVRGAAATNDEIAAARDNLGRR